jgi:hypothetical protein
MYCPQCSQTQTGEVRYCSRCGLSLYEIGRWLAGDSELTVAEDCTMQLSPRRRHILRAAKVAFFSGFLCPIGFVIGQSQREPQWLAIPLLVFVSSLIWMLYCRIFMEGNKPKGNRRQLPTVQENYLPPTRASLALDAHRINTAEIAQPPSVTEYTTNLLRNREDN